MNILVTGAKGFVGKNLVATLNNIAEEKDKTYGIQRDINVYEYDLDSSLDQLEEYCQKADFVFNLAGVNRPDNTSKFMQVNFGFASVLLELLRKYDNKCPVMLASSIQATLIGRYSESEYGKSKLAGEKLFFDYGLENNSKVLVYRFPNLFGKWCRPNYNSVIATFCHNIANDLPVQVNDINAKIEFVYIDDLINEMISALQGKEHHCEYDGIKAIANNTGKYCYVPVSHNVTLGEVVELLQIFKNQPKNLLLPEIANDSFAKKLYSTYLSYLPKDKVAFALNMNVDDRGSFTELLRTEKCGQFSINVSKPGVTKGQHWHHSKWEFFIVVSGEGLIQQRQIHTDEVLEFYVTGDKLEVIHILPGYTHNIINLSDTEDLVTVMWSNEMFDAVKPDTYFCEVKKNDQ